MRTYFIGAPIEDLKGGLFSGVKSKIITQAELVASIQNEDNIRLFESYDEATAYAHGLRQQERGFLTGKVPTASSIRKSKVRPVFTLELQENFNLGNLYTETFSYEERRKNSEDHTTHALSKTVELHFHEVPGNSISINDIIRAEFFGSNSPAVEFSHGSEKSCVIL